MRNKEEDTKIFPFTGGLIGLMGVRTRQDTREIAEIVTSGEFGDLLQLTLRLQELEASPANRNALSEALVQWVKSQHQIKRTWLADRLRKLDWLLPPTAIKSLDDPSG